MHPVAYIVGPDFHKEVEPAQALIYNLYVGGLLPLVVQGDSQVPVGLDNFRVGLIKADRKG